MMIGRIKQYLAGATLLGLACLCNCDEVQNTKYVKQNGDNLTLTCTTEADSIKWKINGVPAIQTSSRGSGKETTSTLELTNLTIQDAGEYECHTMDQTLKNITLTIISISGEGQSVVGNMSLAQLSCTVDNEDLIVSDLKWKRGDESLSNSSQYTISVMNPSTTLTVSNPGDADAGLYTCVVTIEDMEGDFKQSFGLNVAPTVAPITKMRSKVEGEEAIILCNVTGFPVPDIKWYKLLEDSSDIKEVMYDSRVNTTAKNGVADSVLRIRDLKIEMDRGEYTCVATNFLGTANTTVMLKVKDKLAAVWPFLGICAEVAVLCIIIFIFEKRRNRRMEEEEEVDAVKQDLMNKSNGTDGADQEVRQRNNAAAKA